MKNLAISKNCLTFAAEMKMNAAIVSRNEKTDLIMIEREPFKPTIRKEDFWEEEEKYLIGVEHYRQAIFLPALTIEEIVDLQAAINNLLSEKQ